jgi:hypothetical protein
MREFQRRTVSASTEGGLHENEDGGPSGTHAHPLVIVTLQLADE